MLRKSGIPIFFIHFGLSDYLSITLKQAAAASHNSDVILLTDHIRELPSHIIQIPVADYMSTFENFKNKYRHISVNKPTYELICYARWFVLHEFAKKHCIERFCVFDSDVMLFAPVEVFAWEFMGYSAGNWAWANFFSRLSALEKLCRYYEEIFSSDELTDKLATKYSWKGGPHLSDMYLLYEFAEHNPEIMNQHPLTLKGYDSNVQLSDNVYVMNGPIKLITMGPEKIPLAKRIDNGAVVPFKFLHFQGFSKGLMAQLAW